MFLSTNKKVTGVWNSEVGSRKSMEKAEDIQFHPWNTTYIFTAVKIQLFIFSRLWNKAFLKNALYLFNIFLYFITLYIIKPLLTSAIGWPLFSPLTSLSLIQMFKRLFITVLQVGDSKAIVVRNRFSFFTKRGILVLKNWASLKDFIF